MGKARNRRNRMKWKHPWVRLEMARQDLEKAKAEHAAAPEGKKLAAAEDVLRGSQRTFERRRVEWVAAGEPPPPDWWKKRKAEDDDCDA